MNIVVVRVLIEEPNKAKSFKGTAFFINNNTLVTAKHVVQEAIDLDYKIYISEIPNAGKLLIPIESIKLCERDIAVISLKKEFEIPPVSFNKNIQVGLDVDLIGYHNEDGAINHYKHNISGYMNEQHTYEIQDDRTGGLSGSPILLDGKVCGIAQAISTDKGVTYIIPISELCMQVEFAVEADTEKESLEKVQNEIEEYIVLNEFNKATQMIVSLVSKTTDNKKLRREALLHQGTARSLQDEIRQYGKNSDIERQLKRLSSSLFEFLDLIVDDYNRTI